MNDVQSEGFLGKVVSLMIRRTVRSRFRNVYWRHESGQNPDSPETWNLPETCIFVANHQGWHDGYLLFHVVNAVQRRSLDWIQEYDQFPLFGKVGGMPFGLNRPEERAATVRKTIRLMNEESRSLMLFAEGVLHRGPDVWELGRSLELVHRRVPKSVIIPVAIHYDMSIHERPEVFLTIGQTIERGEEIIDRTREKLVQLRNQMISEFNGTLTSESLMYDAMKRPNGFGILAKGTGDVNERMPSLKKPSKSAQEN